LLYYRLFLLGSPFLRPELAAGRGLSFTFCMPFLLVNKPVGWTSHDVVAKLRGILREKKIGHAGTLDPFAMGLLIVGVGREATKRLDEFKRLEKEYEVAMKFGFVSDSYDCDGVIAPHPLARPVAKEELEKILPKYRGVIEQVPPMFSAKKVGGKKLYELARQGAEIERRPQTVTIFELEILECAPDSARLRVVCSSGTYIRSLVHDIGQDLGAGAYAAALVRTRIGPYRLSEAKTIEQISRPLSE